MPLMIEVKNLTKKFGDFSAVRGISFNIDKQSGITALLGPNGAGKTTTLRLLTGYLQATEGEITINGVSLKNKGSSSKYEDDLMDIKRNIGYLPESTTLYPEMLVSEYLQFAGQIQGLNQEQLEKSARDMIEKLELGSHLYTPIGILSKGFRQRVALAGTLIHNPGIIILDEPTSGLDPNQIVQIQNLIRELGKNSLLILSSHILQEVEDVCEQVIIINRGEVVADQPVSQLTNVHSCALVARGDGILDKLSSLDVVKSCSAADLQASLPEGYVRYLCELQENAPEKLFAGIRDSGWDVREFSPISRSLQDIFQELTF